MSSSMPSSSSHSSSSSSRRRRKYSSMDSIYSIVFGLALRSVVGLASKQDWKVAAPIVGLWEGVITLHFMKMMPSSFDPYISWAVRMFIDYMVTESISRMVLVIIWTCLGMALADVAPSIWHDVGLHRPWRRVRRDMYTIYKMTPKVLPRTRIVRFSSSRHSIIDTPMTFPEIDISERTTVVSDTNPPDSPVIERRSSRRRTSKKTSGYSTASASEAGSATPISRRSAPSPLSVPTPVPALRTHRATVYHEPASDIDDSRSYVSEDVDRDNLSSGRSSSSTSLPGSTQATPKHEDWDLESSIASAPEIDVEEDLLATQAQAQAIEAAAKKDEADDSTPRARHMYLPPTPSDSAARWDLSIADNKDHVLPPPTAFLQQIPDDDQDYDHVAPAISVLSKVTEETGLGLKAPSPPSKDDVNLPESYRKSSRTPMINTLGLETPDPTPMIERGPSAANTSMTVPIARAPALEKVWENATPRNEPQSIIAVPAGPSSAIPQPPAFTANMANLTLFDPSSPTASVAATPTTNANGYATAISPAPSVEDEDDMYLDEATSNSLREQYARDAEAEKKAADALDYAKLLEERQKAEEEERKRIIEEKRRRLDEERIRYEAEQRRLAEEVKRQEEERVRFEDERRKQAEEKLAIEAERRKQEEERQRLDEEAKRQEEERAKFEEERRKFEQEAKARAEHDEEERARKEAQRVAEEAERLAAEARQLEEEAMARKAAEEEAQRLADEEEARRLAAEEEAQRLAAEEEAQRLAVEEEARLAEEANRLAAEAEAKRVADEEEAMRLAQAEAQRLADEVVAIKLAEEEAAARLAAEQAEAEAERLAAEAEAQRLAAEEAARLAAEAEALRLATEAEEKRLADEEAERVRVALEEERQRAADEEAKRVWQEAEDKRLAEVAAEAERKRLEDEEQEAKRIADEAAAEAKRMADEMAEKARLAAEAEAQRVAAEAAAAEAEAQRVAAEEAERIRVAEEAAAVEAQRVAAEEAEQKRLAELEEARRAAEEARLAAEEVERIRLAEEEQQKQRLAQEAEARQLAEQDSLKALEDIEGGKERKKEEKKAKKAKRDERKKRKAEGAAKATADEETAEQQSLVAEDDVAEQQRLADEAAEQERLAQAAVEAALIKEQDEEAERLRQQAEVELAAAAAAEEAQRAQVEQLKQEQEAAAREAEALASAAQEQQALDEAVTPVDNTAAPSSEPSTPTPITVQVATPTTAQNAALDPEDGDADAQGEEEEGGELEHTGSEVGSVMTVATQYTEVASDIKSQLQKAVLRRAQKVELQDQLNALKSDPDTDPAVIARMEKITGKYQKKIQRMYEDSKQMALYWKRPEENYVLKSIPVRQAEDHVREALLWHLTPECHSFKFSLTCPAGKGTAVKKIKDAVVALLRNELNIDPIPDPNNGKILTVEITPSEFELWVLDFRQRSVRGDD